MVIKRSLDDLKNRAARWPNGKAAFLLRHGKIVGDSVIVDDALQKELDAHYPTVRHFGTPFNLGRFNLAQLNSSTHVQPVGYADFILARGKIEGDWILLDNNAQKELREKFHPNLGKPLPPTPTLTELASNFSTAIASWAQAGFKVVESTEYSRRHTICLSCEFWKPDALLGTGKCRKCGCSKVKLWLVTSRCPDKPSRW